MDTYENKSSGNTVNAIANDPVLQQKPRDPLTQPPVSAPPPGTPVNFQKMADSSTQVKQLKKVQAMADNRKQPVQCMPAMGAMSQAKATDSKVQDNTRRLELSDIGDTTFRGMMQPYLWEPSQDSNAGQDAGISAKTIQRMIIPQAVSGAAEAVDTDEDAFHQMLAGLGQAQLLKLIVYMENHPDHNGFDVVYAYNRLWPLVGPDPIQHNAIVDHLNAQIPHKLAKVPEGPGEPPAAADERSGGSAIGSGSMAAASAGPLSGSGRPAASGSPASHEVPADHSGPGHVAIDMSGAGRPVPDHAEAPGSPAAPLAHGSGLPLPPSAASVGNEPFAPAGQAPHTVVEMGASGGAGHEPAAEPMPVGPAPEPDDDAAQAGVQIHIDAGGGHPGGGPPDGDGPPGAGGPPPEPAGPRGWDRLRRKGFGGTTFGDIANSMGVASTAAGQATSDSGVVGGFGIAGGLGVAAGGISQIATGSSPVDTVKGGTNFISGALGVASGARAIHSNTSDYAAAVLGRISGGAWGVAEAINFAQKVSSICENGIWTRDTLHALNSLIKATAGFLIAGSSAQPVLIAASVLGGIGAASSVILGLHKLYQIYQESGDPAAAAPGAVHDAADAV